MRISDWSSDVCSSDLVMDLTGMAMANASMLDEATAAAEAMTMCRRLSKAEGNTFFVAADCHPQTIEVVRTRAEPLGIEIAVEDPRRALRAARPFGLLLQYPATGGALGDYAKLVAAAAEAGAQVTVAADLLSLTLDRKSTRLNSS